MEENLKNNVAEFVEELNELSRKYRLKICSCCCTNGAWTEDIDTGKESIKDLCWDDDNEEYGYTINDINL